MGRSIMHLVVGNADKLALFAAVEFVVVDVLHGIENQPASGFDFNGATGCIKQGGMGTNIAAGFDFDTLDAPRPTGSALAFLCSLISVTCLRLYHLPVL